MPTDDLWEAARRGAENLTEEEWKEIGGEEYASDERGFALTAGERRELEELREAIRALAEEEEDCPASWHNSPLPECAMCMEADEPIIDRAVCWFRYWRQQASERLDAKGSE